MLTYARLARVYMSAWAKHRHRVTRGLGSVACVVSASLLIAIHAASILESDLSPYLAYLDNKAVLNGLMMLLLISGPLTHLSGIYEHASYRFWQPMEGGNRFIVLQVVGWCMYFLFCAGVLAIVAHSVGVLPYFMEYSSWFDACFSILVAIVGAVAQISILVSTFVYKGARVQGCKCTFLACYGHKQDDTPSAPASMKPQTSEYLPTAFAIVAATLLAAIASLAPAAVLIASVSNPATVSPTAVAACVIVPLSAWMTALAGMWRSKAERKLKQQRQRMQPYRWLARQSTTMETIKLVVGCAVLLCWGPYVIVQVAACKAWDFLDQHALGIVALCERCSARVSPVLGKYTKHPEDGFMLPLMVWLGIVLPAWYSYELWHAYTFGFDWRRAVVYNIIRIGPEYRNFMFVYVLAHKEAHNFGNLLKNPPTPLKYLFNHWVGLFHGVLPGTFTYSHVYNHHTYDNSDLDIYCTAFRARNSFTAWVRYIPEWLGYASNVSSILAFAEEDRWGLAISTLLWTLYYLAFVWGSYCIAPLFTLCTLVYAFFEGNILLSVVNWVWHAFIDPTDPCCKYVNSTNIIDGLNFTLDEQYHTVHHQYAGVHWTKHRALYARHKEQYEGKVPTAFYKENIFVVFAHIVAGDYPRLVELFYPPLRGGLSDEQLGLLLKERLECCGPELALSMRPGRFAVHDPTEEACAEEAAPTKPKSQ